MAPETWTIESILRVTKEFFATKGIETARLDAEVLLTSVLSIGRVQLYTQYDRPLSEEELARYRELVRRRAGIEPVAYILGEKEFYGRRFEVTPDVLVPRPETEHLVDAVLEWAKSHSVASILDVGTGSGCIGITLACELPEARIVGTDSSSAALQVAARNAEALAVNDRTEWLEADVFPSAGRFNVIASNPPYVPLKDPRLQDRVRLHEPSSALYAGEDGLDVIRRLVREGPSWLDSPGLIAFELGLGQAEAVRELATDVRFVDDLQGIPRIALVER